MNIKYCFLLLAFSIAYLSTVAQATSGAIGSPRKATYILPDGRVLAEDKLDSLNKAWGAGRVTFEHTKEEDEKGIVRLVRLTDEKKRFFDSLANDNKKAFDAMLGQPAIDFALNDLQGTRWALQTLRGKVVVMNFWFTTCAPCIKEMPELNELVHAYTDKPVVFLALTFNKAEQVRTFLQQRPFHYTLLPGSGEVNERYHISSYPTSMVIDKNGYVKMIIGSSPDIRKKLEDAIKSLL